MTGGEGREKEGRQGWMEGWIDGDEQITVKEG